MIRVEMRLKATQRWEIILSEQPSAPLADDAAIIAETASLDAQLKAIAAERDRHASDKIELITKASALSKELDGLRAQLGSATAERDSLRLQLNAAAAENARLKNQIATAPAPDPVVVLADFASEKTKALVAKARAAIPADSPALPWFDRTIAAVTTAGSVTVTVTRETARWLAPRIQDGYAWAKPRALELYAKAKTEIEAKLAKKG